MLKRVLLREVFGEGTVARDGFGKWSFVGKGEVADGGFDGGGDAAAGGFAPAFNGVGLVVHLVHDVLEVEGGAGFVIETGDIVVTSGLVGEDEVSDDVGGRGGPGRGVEGFDGAGDIKLWEELVAHVFKVGLAGDEPAAPAFFHRAAMICDKVAGVGVNLAAGLGVDAANDVAGDTGGARGMVALQAIVMTLKAGLQLGLLFEDVEDCAQGGVGCGNFEVVCAFDPADVCVVVEVDSPGGRRKDERSLEAGF